MNGFVADLNCAIRNLRKHNREESTDVGARPDDNHTRSTTKSVLPILVEI